MWRSRTFRLTAGLMILAAAVPWAQERGLDEGTYDLRWSEPNTVGVSQLGRAVALLGDVNADGADDMIVGAYGYYNAAGRGYVHFGGADADTLPDLFLEAEEVTDLFGFAVADAGDVNADGYADILVGAPGHAGDIGRAYVYFGGPAIDGAFDLALDGEFRMDAFGMSLTGAGDVNGDEFDDIAIGANGFNGNTGRVYIYFGGPALDAVPDLILDGEVPYDIFGSAIAGPGDLDDDGWDDLCVGAPWAAEGIGRGYVFCGGPGLDALPDLLLNGEDAGNSFAYALSSAGDFNHDGARDLLVGAPGYHSSMGRAYVFFGGAGFDAEPDAIIDGAGGSFGYKCAGGGDVDGDAWDDLLIGAPWYANAAGRAYLYCAGSTTAAAMLDGTAPEDYCGMSVAIAGNFGGDGGDDLLIGLPGHNDSTGRAQLYFGGAPMGSADLLFDGEGCLNHFGHALADLLDVNDDGFADMVVSATGRHSYHGRVYLYLGGPVVDAQCDLMIEDHGDQVACAGDVNRDGYEDIVVGCAAHDDYTGRGSIFFGGDPIDGIADVVMHGEAVDNYFGFSAAGAGDVNADGYDDVIVGAIWNNNYRGRAYLFLGGPAMDGVPDILLNGEFTWDEFGWSVAGAGDLNGDGYDDVVVGARGFNDDTGRAYVFLGGETMDADPDLILEGELPGGYFGMLVRGIGDVNGDLCADLLVASDRFADDAGRAYIFLGGTAMDPCADLILDGAAPNDGFGSSTAGLGDLNEDGYGDFIVGADGWNGWVGRAYIFHGGETLDEVPDIVLDGEGPWQHFGNSVTGGGDVNGGGRHDVLVGADQYPANGAAYLYYGEAAVSGRNEPDSRRSAAMGLMYRRQGDGHLRLEYELTSPGSVDLAIYDVTGQRIRSLASGLRLPGRHHAVWDRRDDAGRLIAAGVYYARLRQGGRQACRSVLVLR